MPLALRWLLGGPSIHHETLGAQHKPARCPRSFMPTHMKNGLFVTQLFGNPYVRPFSDAQLFMERTNPLHYDEAQVKKEQTGDGAGHSVSH